MSRTRREQRCSLRLCWLGRQTPAPACRGAPGELPGAQAPPGHVPRSHRRAAGWPACRLPGHPGGRRCLRRAGLLRFLPGVWRGAACLRPADNERGPGARTRSQAARAACPGPAHPPAPNEAPVLQSAPEPGPAPAGEGRGARGNRAGFSRRQGEGWQGRGGGPGGAGRRGACCHCGPRASQTSGISSPSPVAAPEGG